MAAEKWREGPLKPRRVAASRAHPRVLGQLATVAAPALAALFAVTLYAWTLAPGLTWAHDGGDGGDFLAAAVTGGVPHPTGYPTYQLLLRAATLLQPGNPARAGNWLSAVCAALAAGLLADLARRALPVSRVRVIVALTAALAWATSPTLWSQAVITEVYTLNALAVILVLWLLFTWAEIEARKRSAYGRLAATALVFGLGLGNHLSLALVLPGAAAWLWSHREHLRRLRGRQAAALPGFVVLGLFTYARLPVAAAAGPPVNWGDPHTPAAFWWLVSGAPYRHFMLGGASPAELLARLSSWVRTALEQLGGGPWGAMVAVAGLWWLDRNRHAWWRATGLIALAYTLFGLSYGTDTSFIYLIPAWAMAALWLAAGLAWGIEAVAARWPSRHVVWGAVLAALLVFTSAPVLRFHSINDLSEDREATDFIDFALEAARENAIVLTATDRPTFALWYAIYALGRRRDITPINANLYDYAWYRGTLRKWHPAVFEGQPADAPLDTFLLAAASRFPIYRAEEVPIALTAATETREGPLVEMRFEP